MPVEPRTYEGHMDWDYADSRGPVDPHSPFTQLVGQNKFTSSFATPAKQQMPQVPPSTSKTPYYTPQPPSTALFAPHLTRTNTTKASPFRNPAFTTPRKPFDDIQLSEAESSPGNATDDCYGADISELADQSLDFDGDVSAGALSPTRVDKKVRYRAPLPRDRALSVNRLHMSGRGEISRHPREVSARDVVRKRRRHGPDKDVSESVRRWGAAASDDDDDDESGSGSESESGLDVRSKLAKKSSSRKLGRLGRVSKKIGALPDGPLSVFFTALDRYPDAPERLTKWGLFLLNATVLGVGVWFVWGIVGGIRHDMAEGIRAELDAVRAKVASCTADFKANNCDSPLPALRIQCADWGNCMMDSPEAHLRFKIFAKQFAEIINEFSNTMHLKGWAFFFAVFLIILSLNVFGRRNIQHMAPSYPQQPHQPTPQQQQQQTMSHDMPQPSPYPAHHFGMWVPSQGMHALGHHPSLFGANRPDEAADDTEVQSPDGKYRPMLQPPPQTPSRRRSPAKQQYLDWERERSRSPTKRGAIRYH